MTSLSKESRGFGKSVRLSGRSNFLEVHYGKNSKRYPGEYLTILTSKADGESTRFGISVSKKVGNAVCRNRIKRIIREYLRNNKNLWPANRKIVISVKDRIADQAGLLAEIEILLRQISE